MKIKVEILYYHLRIMEAVRTHEQMTQKASLFSC
jgi:hypothetical protein